MRRRRVIRRVARITPVAIEAHRRSLELAGAVKACEKARHAAERRARVSGDYTDYHGLLPPCGESCACVAELEAYHVVRRELGLMPHEIGTEREAELYAALDEAFAENER